ncbi:Programmed cell death protein 2 [Aphelenchoides fujianensis]|nr:Programmed cell death protein 2 [Aphelenchoides fujianensis]
MSGDDVKLGLPRVLREDELYQLRRHYLPLGKVGGKPQWLDPVRVPKAEDVKCGVCSKPMAFVVQIYGYPPNAPFPPSAFHRYLYVFVCRNGECSKPNEAANLKVLRSQLPLKNPFFATAPLDPTVEVEDPFFDETKFAHLCNTCGLKATSKCAKCSQAWYCSRDHQVIDWTSGHRAKCGKTAEESEGPKEEVDDAAEFALGDRSRVPPENSFLFREYGLTIGTDYERPGHADGEESGSDEEDEAEDEQKQAEQREEAKRIMEDIRAKENNEQAADGGAADPLELLDEEEDRAYNDFCRAVGRNPRQLLRYALGGRPLSATDRSPLPSVEAGHVPNCERCGTARVFEFQLMPHLLSLLEVDAPGASVDWAAVFVFTCKNSCDLGDAAFTPEFCAKQDFVGGEADVGEPVGKEDEDDG